MTQILRAVDSQASVVLWLSRKVSEQLKFLLETKHLYQKVEIGEKEIAQFAQALYNRTDVWSKEIFHRWINEQLPRLRFSLAQKPPSVTAKGSNAAEPGPTLILLHLSLFCKKCDRREAFAPVWWTDLTDEIHLAVTKGLLKEILLPVTFQMFVVAYQCQRCLGSPEGFLIRREGWILSLHGRSPIERIEIPNYIPRTESSLYRDAVIAFNTGKILAALFYLRTFIEQFARRITGITGRATGEEILDAYYETLPREDRSHMPSLREWYDKLSEALHSAREDAALFEAARAEVEKHFDIRRVFNIAEPRPTTADRAEAQPSKTQ